MGQMQRSKSYELKKVYIQTLINGMQDVLDLANQHNLLGEVIYSQLQLRLDLQYYFRPYVRTDP